METFTLLIFSRNFKQQRAIVMMSWTWWMHDSSFSERWNTIVTDLMFTQMITFNYVDEVLGHCKLFCQYSTCHIQILTEFLTHFLNNIIRNRCLRMIIFWIVFNGLHAILKDLNRDMRKVTKQPFNCTLYKQLLWNVTNAFYSTY